MNHYPLHYLVKASGALLEFARYRSMEKPPIRTNYIEHDCGCRRWYESVVGGPVEELTEVVEYCSIHEIESESS